MDLFWTRFSKEESSLAITTSRGCSFWDMISIGLSLVKSLLSSFTLFLKN